MNIITKFFKKPIIEVEKPISHATLVDDFLIDLTLLKKEKDYSNQCVELNNDRAIITPNDYLLNIMARLKGEAIKYDKLILINMVNRLECVYISRIVPDTKFKIKSFLILIEIINKMYNQHIITDTIIDNLEINYFEVLRFLDIEREENAEYHDSYVPTKFKTNKSLEILKNILNTLLEYYNNSLDNDNKIMPFLPNKQITQL